MKRANFDVYELSIGWAQGRSDLFLWASETTTSTNAEAKSVLLPLDKDQGVFLSRHQTQGRGRGSHTWSDAGEGAALLSTWVYRLRQSPRHVTAPLFGLALFNAARRTWNSLAFSLKAPNDLLLGGKKVGGLLIESLNHGPDFFVLVGLGINVFAAPSGVVGAGFLTGAEGVGDALSTNEWQDFLNHLHQEFVTASELCVEDSLHEHSRNDLMRALNSNPLLSAPIIDVSASGDLIYADKKTSWQDL